MRGGNDTPDGGTTLTIYQEDTAVATLTGWTGPQITSTQDLIWALDANLVVEYPGA